MQNFFKKKIGLVCAIFCLFVPILSRIPRGMDWVMQYLSLPTSGFLLFGILNLIPAVFVFLTSLYCRTKYYLPLIFAFVPSVRVSYLAVIHYYLDLGEDAQSAIGLGVAPIYVSVLVILGGLIGFAIESFLLCEKN